MTGYQSKWMEKKQREEKNRKESMVESSEQDRMPELKKIIAAVGIYQDLHKVKTFSILASSEHQLQVPIFSWRGIDWLLQGKGESVFFNDVVPGRLTMLTWVALYPWIHRYHKWYTVDCLQKKRGFETRKC